MKKWLTVLLVLILAVTVWIGSYYWPVWTADCVVRVSYTGFNAMFREPYVYYAICGTDAVRISPRVLEQVAPEVISGSRYNDMSSTQWFGRLIYAPYVSYFESKDFLHRNDPWLPTTFGDTYRVYYDHWGGAEKLPDEAQQAVLVRAAEKLHSGDINDMSSMSLPERGLIWYILVSNEEYMLLQLKEEQLYRPMEDGTFALVMDCPEGGQFDYYWFP